MTQPPPNDPWFGNNQGAPQSPQGSQHSGQGSYPAQQGSHQAQAPAAPQAPSQGDQYGQYQSQGYAGQQGGSEQPGPYAGPQFAQATTSQEPGFMASLFDLKFRSYATPRIISVVYVVAMVLIGIYVLLSLLYSILLFLGGAAAATSSFNSDSSGFLVFVGIVNLLLTPLFGFFSLLVVRLGLEFFSTQFSMAQDLKALREDARK